MKGINMRKSILDELVNANRMPVLFIGSGISKRYLYGYPSWEELLEKSFNKYESDPFQYQKYLDECRRKKCQILKLMCIWEL